MRTLRLLLIVRRVQAAQLNQQKSLYEAVFDQRLSATGEHIRQFLYYLEQVIARRDDMSPPPADCGGSTSVHRWIRSPHSSGGLAYALRASGQPHSN